MPDRYQTYPASLVFKQRKIYLVAYLSFLKEIQSIFNFLKLKPQLKLMKVA